MISIMKKTAFCTSYNSKSFGETVFCMSHTQRYMCVSVWETEKDRELGWIFQCSAQQMWGCRPNPQLSESPRTGLARKYTISSSLYIFQLYRAALDEW